MSGFGEIVVFWDVGGPCSTGRRSRKKLEAAGITWQHHFRIPGFFDLLNTVVFVALNQARFERREATFQHCKRFVVVDPHHECYGEECFVIHDMLTFGELSS